MYGKRMPEPDAGGKSILGRFAVFAAIVTATLYLLGLLSVGLTVSEVGEGAHSTPMRECQSAPNRPQDARLLEHEVRLLPLHVMCRTTDGLFTSPVVPSWFNPALATSLAATVALTAGVIVRANRRTRPTSAFPSTISPR